MDKPPFERECPDCHKTYIVDETYSDGAYEDAQLGDPCCVCPQCYADFDGMTLEELIR